ncbi:MAG: hypothetical protein JWO36_492 [Myxococcales bacterium]|nr:hypothetical protein [Myxococcales bacterium]
MRIALAMFALAACSGRSVPPPTPIGPPAPIVAPSANADDLSVAQVNGRPVWGSCVTAQAARGRTRDIALRECIDFELMAQAADARGLATDPDVVDATRTALVNQLVANAYEDSFTKPENFGDKWDRLVERNLFPFKHEEFRASTYVRVPLGETATPEEDAAAHALADKIAAALASETGMLSPQFVELAGRAAGLPMVKTGEEPKPARWVEYADVEPRVPRALYKSYADALWAIPEVGRASPAVRTKWGWDIVLFSELEPAVDTKPDELARRMMPEVKRSYFMLWVNEITKHLGITVELYKDNIARLEDAQ